VGGSIVSLLLSACPLWLTFILLVVLPTVLAAVGLVVVRGRVGLERLVVNNEVAGFKFAVVGVIYAVLLAFAVIVVWERYSDAEIAVVHEAGAAATIYRLAAGAEPAAVESRRAIDRYLQLVIEQDWQRMSAERESHEVTAQLSTLYGDVLEFVKTGTRPMPVMTELLAQLDAITQARRERLHLAIGIVPSVLWMALSLGGVLTVAFTFFFGAENLRAQMLMTGILAFIVFMGLFVIVSIDHPFTGTVHVGSEPLQHVLEDFAGR
jgi:Protein of unknown function (DUF4239)